MTEIKFTSEVIGMQNIYKHQVYERIFILIEIKNP